MGEPNNVDTTSIGSSLMNDLDSERSSLASVKCDGHPVLKKCCRKGDKIYYSNSEHIKMMQERTGSGQRMKSSFDAANQVDKVLSGESLYKKFSFEQGSNDEDTEKCIAFWKSVMEKNLVPIKCTIIENVDKEEVHEADRKNSVTSKEETIVGKTTAANIHDYYKKMWQTALSELQRRRLHEIKLLGKTRCKMCESVSSSVSDNQDSAKIIKEEVVELNEWEPVALEKGKPSVRAQVRRLQIAGQESVCNCCGFANCVCKSQDVEILSVDTLPDGTGDVRPDVKTYKFVDIIQQKKSSGAYCEWRSNKVKSPCPCDYSICDCNTNPAILSMKAAAARPPPKGLCECGSAICDCKENLQISESKYNVSDRSDAVLPQDDLRDNTLSSFKSEEWESVCDCGHPDCDCNEKSLVSSVEATTPSSGKFAATDIGEEEEVTLFPEEIKQERSVCQCATLDCSCNENQAIPSVDTVVPEFEANKRSIINIVNSHHSGVELQSAKSSKSTQSEEKMVDIVNYEKKVE